MQGTRKEEGSMTKSDLIEVVANKLHLPKGKAELIVNCIFDSMIEALKKGEGIAGWLCNDGAPPEFRLKETAAVKSRNQPRPD